MVSYPPGVNAVPEGQRLFADVPAFRPYLGGRDIPKLLERFEDVLRRGELTKGRYVQGFEARVAERMGAGFEAIAVASGTIALEALYESLGVRGHEVIVPANTFVATAAAAVNSGASVRFVDIDPRTLAPSVEQLDKAISQRTKVVVLCHMGGLISPETPALIELCEGRGVMCIEDSAQALGVCLNGRPAGTFGRAAMFSFFPGKVITTGEGGMIVTRDHDLARTVRALRDQGRDLDRVYRRPGHNWRLTEFQAALGEFQVGILDEIIALRTAIADTYATELSGVPGLALPDIGPG